MVEVDPPIRYPSLVGARPPRRAALAEGLGRALGRPGPSSSPEALVVSWRRPPGGA